MKRRADVLKEACRLEKHVEGGWFSEVYTAPFEKDGRPLAGSIYFLLDAGEVSRFHRIDCDEIWYYHDGPALEMLLVYEDHDEIRYLGKDISNSEEPQIRVPAGTFMGAVQKEKGDYTLVSTSMTPAYDPDEFQSATYEDLKERCTHRDLLKKLTE